jgi:hypothetical protein
VAVTLAYALGYALFIVKLRFRIPVLPLVFVPSGNDAVSVARYLGHGLFSGCQSARPGR